MDAHCKETACLAGYSKDDKTQNQLLEESGSGQLQAGWSEEWPRRCPEIQQNHKALHLSTVKQAEQPVRKQEGIRGSFLNRSLGQEVSQTSRSAKGGEAHHRLSAVLGPDHRASCMCPLIHPGHPPHPPWKVVWAI